MTVGELRQLLLEHMAGLRAEHVVVIEVQLRDGSKLVAEVEELNRHTRYGFALKAREIDSSR